VQGGDDVESWIGFSFFVVFINMGCAAESNTARQSGEIADFLRFSQTSLTSDEAAPSDAPIYWRRMAMISRWLGLGVKAQEMSQEEALRRYFYTVSAANYALQWNVLEEVCNILNCGDDAAFRSQIAWDMKLDKRDFASIDQQYLDTYYGRNVACYSGLSALLAQKNYPAVLAYLPTLVNELGGRTLAAPLLEYFALRRLWKEGLPQCISVSGMNAAWVWRRCRQVRGAICRVHGFALESLQYGCEFSTMLG